MSQLSNTGTSSPASSATHHHRPSPPSPLQGDPFVSRRDAGAIGNAFDRVCDGKDINVALGTTDSSSVSTRKRRLSHSGDDDATDDTTPTSIPAAISESTSRLELSPTEQPKPTLPAEAGNEPQVAFGDAPESWDIEVWPDTEGAASAEPRGEAEGGCADADDGGVECSPDSSRLSRRTLYIEYWSRTDECKERKWDHLDAIAEQYGAAEDAIFDTTLRGRTACLEPNMFPYNTPAGIEHWTLWHVNELSHNQIKQYVENWIDANAPHVASWNYDDNPERSIDIFHVHVYLQVPTGATVLQGRAYDDLVHEMD